MANRQHEPALLFVLEQSLGHATHGRNLEQFLLSAEGVSATTLRVGTRMESRLAELPVLRTWSFQASWQARGAIRRHLARTATDAAYIHTQVPSLLAVGSMHRVPTIISMDATPMNYDEVGMHYGHARQSAPAERIKWQVNRRAFNAARVLFTWSRWAARSLVSDYGVSESKVAVVRPGVDMARFKPGDEAPHDGVRILFVGGDFERKGGYDLLDALRLLEGPIVLDVVTGSDVQTSDPRVRVHRGVTHGSEQLVKLFRRADMFALPSKSECYGIATSEALACALPVVACDVGAVREMVRDNENGYIVPASSPRRLAEALRALVSRVELRRGMASKSLELARQEHDAARNNRFIIDVMSDIAIRARRRW